jgi:hypothetical protein
MSSSGVQMTGHSHACSRQIKASALAFTAFAIALDAYAAKAYWDLDRHTLRYLQLASERHLGTLSFETSRTRFVTL